MADYLDGFIKELLHLDDVRTNRLIDAGSDGDKIKGYRLSSEGGLSCAKMLCAIKNGVGKVSNRTVLKDSALVRTNVDNPAVEKWLWRDLSGSSDPKALDAFITDAYKALNLKGNNPLFLGLGALEWEVAVSDEIKKVCSPLLIFPIKLIRGTATSSVEIEFVDDDAYFNPCLIERLKRDMTGYVSGNFPSPNGGTDFDEPIDLDKLDLSYFDKVDAHVKECAEGAGGAFAFNRDALIIAQYSHADVCMYYDVRRNREKIDSHPLIRRIFGEKVDLPPVDESAGEPRFVLPKDSVQEDIIRRIVRGQSLIVKGPPGTGKTLTIANIIAALLARGKKVIFASKKLSALAEVNAKLPENLRKFVMLLDYETEQKAAAVNPADVKRSFKALVKERSEYHFDGAASSGYEKAVRDCADAVLEINEYFKDVFASGYYDVIDSYYKSNLPALPFATSDEVAKVSASEYNGLLSEVEDAGKFWNIMTDGKGGIAECPWFGVGDLKDTEGALALNSAICGGISKINAALQELGLDEADELRLGDLYLTAGGNVLSRTDVEKLLAAKLPVDYAEITKVLNAYEERAENAPAGFAFKDGGAACFNDLAVAAEELKKYGGDTPLTNGRIKLLGDHAYLFFVNGEPYTSLQFERLCELVKSVREYEDKAKEREFDCLAMLDKLESGDYAEALKTYARISPYASNGKKKIGFFDFKGKKAYKYLLTKTSRREPKLKDIAGAIVALRDFEDNAEEARVIKGFIGRVLGGRMLTDDELACAYFVADTCREKADAFGFVGAATKACSVLKLCAEECSTPHSFTVDELLKSREVYLLRAELKRLVESICQSAQISDSGDEIVAARSFATVLRAKGLKPFKNQTEKLVEYFEKIKELGAAFAEETGLCAKKMRTFGVTYFESVYTVNPWKVTVAGLKRFASQAENRAVLSAAAGYHKITADNSVLSLAVFFAYLEKGEVFVESGRFGELFEHSFSKLTLDYALTRLGKRRNGLGKNAQLALDKFERAEGEMLKCNAGLIENLCMSRIDADDPDFAFLNADRGAPRSLRYLFKTQAEAIVKLKRCFILSPSTASVLFRPEAFSDFDVVIVDEASQLEPVNLLSVLVRAKQCVLVGDEFQMPPLTHFKVKNKGRIDDIDSELALDSDISALSLALHNEAFESRELLCHYRSNTEALIAFSQREFYPYMRTFPAALPFADGLGFEDVYTPEGCSEGGVNETEAQKAVEKLAEHFEKYYNEDTGVLSRSVGVVAFGEAQLAKITSLVQKNAALNAKIERAIEKFDDLPEKLVFFRTIESVQGQETDHLILSITYGRDKNGNVRLIFGELNRDALGKNIFNVAVTRAQSFVTVIHSLTAEQISANARIKFIGDYLALVRKYSDGGRDRFLSTLPEKGANFISSVCDYLAECGITRERIVVGYGVTDGSVKIPVAVLSKDLTRAELGIWCETPVLKKYDYLDYNVRYVRSLIGRGWNIYRISAHEWYDNGKFEKDGLKKVISKLI